MIARARHSIDFVTYSQNTDDINIEFLKAIRQAQLERGIAVRAIYDAQVSSGDKEKNKAVRSLITDSELACPGEVMCAHPIEKLSSGVSLMDYVHEKIMIIDAGTADEIIFFSGRGTTVSSAQFMDTGFMIRRIEPGLPYAGDDLKSLFGSLWDSLKKMADRSIFKMRSQTGKPFKKELDLVRKGFAETADQAKTVAEILELLDRSPKAVPPAMLKSFQFHPEMINVLSNDLFKQLIDGKDLRAAFSNDNHEALIRDIRKFSGTLEMTAYSFGPSRELHDALVDFIKRGNTLNIFTNGAPAWVTANPAVWKQGFPAYYTYESVLKLMDETKGAPGKVNLSLVHPDKAKAENLATWVHRKLFSFKDAKTREEEFVYIGSDNFTWSAAKKNDEVLVKVKDARFTKAMTGLTHAERVGYEEVDRAALEALNRARPLWYRCVRGLVKTLF
jgi:phosphatidylserine/phosphatidylglycerophosphate/cardiolipin synthase-like enzyme